MGIFIILIKFNLFLPLCWDTTLKYFQINIKLIGKKNMLKYQPRLKMCYCLLTGKCNQIRERQVNNEVVMIKILYLTSAIRTCVQVKTNPNLSSGFTRKEKLSQVHRSPRIFISCEGLLKGIYT